VRKQFWSDNFRGRYHLRAVEIYGRILLERILEKMGGKMYTGFCEHGDER